MNIYVDLDGVIAEYKRKDYISRNGEEPKFLKKGIHYFKNLSANTSLIEKLKRLSETNKIIVLSALCENNANYEEAYADKIEFTKEHMPFVSEIIITDTKKKHVYAKDSILIDDYNANLDMWEKNGGIGVKYLNGINSPLSWKGYKATTENITSVINKIERRAV